MLNASSPQPRDAVAILAEAAHSLRKVVWLAEALGRASWPAIALTAIAAAITAIGND